MRPFSIILLFSLIALAAGSFHGSVCAQSPLPRPSDCVNDFAGVITPPYEKRMGKVAKELLTKTGVALYLVTMHDLGGSDEKEYAERLYSAWGLGKRGRQRIDDSGYHQRTQAPNP